MKTLDKIDKFLSNLDEKEKKRNQKLKFLFTTEELQEIGLDSDVIQRLMEASKVFVSAYWSGNVLKWRTEDGRSGSDPMKKTTDKKAIENHFKKILGSNVEVEIIKEGFQFNEASKGGKEYDEFFNSMLKKYKVKSYKDLPKDKQKKFFDEVDKAWKAKKETD
jgi:hypothetical protein